MNESTPVPAGMPAIDFLRAYAGGWKPDWYLQLAYLDPEVDTSNPVTLTVRIGDPDFDDKIGQFVDRHNGKGNLYFCPNPLSCDLGKKAKEKHVVAAVTVYVDSDPRDGFDLMHERARIQTEFEHFRPRPSFVVDTGGGMQAFWMQREPIILPRRSRVNTRPKLIGKALAVRFGGDSVQSLDHLMRLPGTVNLPTPRKVAKGRVAAPARLLWWDDRRYTLYAFDGLPAVTPEPEAAAPDLGAIRPESVDEDDMAARLQVAMRADAELDKLMQAAASAAPCDDADMPLARRLAGMDFTDDEIALALLHVSAKVRSLAGDPEALAEYVHSVIASLYSKTKTMAATSTAAFDLSAVDEVAVARRLHAVQIDPELSKLLNREPVRWMKGLTRSHFDFALAFKLAQFNFRDNEIAYLLMRYSLKAAERSNPAKYVNDIVAKVRKGVRHE